MHGHVGAPRTLVGVQGSVMGWDDPWHPEACAALMRTGEGRVFPSQDGRPSVEQYLELLASLGADACVHHVVPDAAAIDAFVDDVAARGVSFLLGNEYGNINGPFGAACNRYDVPDACVAKAARAGGFAGLVYDETEHLQLHPAMYLSYHAGERDRDPRRHQWARVDGMGLQESEDAVVEAVRARCRAYGGGVRLFSEQVFPVMFHALARGGMHPCPKVLKEEFASVQLATALGAARQYGRDLGICVDLWGPDVGDWFHRVWGFPGHPPEEFASALRLAWLMGPALLFVENVDVLARFTPAGFRCTEFGDIFREFTRTFVPGTRRPWTHAMADPDIVVLRADDTAWGEGDHPFGNGTLEHDYRTRSPFRVFHLLSRGRVPANGITFHLPQFSYHSGYYQRTAETMKALPLERGVGPELRTSTHGLFFPMNNVLVLDERADEAALGNPRLILLAGSRTSPGCLAAVARRVRAGALCVAARWLLPEARALTWRDGEGRWIVTDDFESAIVKESVEPYLGEPGVWMQRFGRHEVRFRDVRGDGLVLDYEVREVP